MASSESALLEEISRLSGAIKQRKTAPPPPPQPLARGTPHLPPYGRSNRPASSGFTDYVPNKRPGIIVGTDGRPHAKDVVIDGVTFQSNGKSLVRKPEQTEQTTVFSDQQTPRVNTPRPSPAPVYPLGFTQVSSSALPPTSSVQPLIRTRSSLIAAQRYKSSTSNGKAKLISQQYRPRNRIPSLVTGYSKRALPGRNLTLKKDGPPKLKMRPKKYDKQCKHFTRTGICGRGMTCPYQHDPEKISLCTLFLAGTCPFKESPHLCALSHDPIPERTPLCSRFSATGECYKGAECLYPHVRVGPKTGICRDFAVLGFCDKGVMCEASHLRECPDFAETGECKKMGLKGTAGCKLPHVIRANQHRIGRATSANLRMEASASKRKSTEIMGRDSTKEQKRSRHSAEGENRGSVLALGDVPPGTKDVPDSNDFISLTFLESDEDEDEGEDEDGDKDENEVGEAEENATEVGGGRVEWPILENDEAEEQEVNGELILDDDVNMD